ncbi:unnamed protein product, partial [marine sediment metagenome]
MSSWFKIHIVVFLACLWTADTCLGNQAGASERPVIS